MSDRPEQQVLKVIAELSETYSDPLSNRFYDDVRRQWQNTFVHHFQQQGDHERRHLPQRPTVNHPRAPTVEEYVSNIVEETKHKSGDLKFESHAFKVVADYQKCRDAKSDYWLCLAALLVELASVVIPLARAHTKDKDKKDG